MPSLVFVEVKNWKPSYNRVMDDKKSFKRVQFTPADYDFMKMAQEVGTRSGCVRSESRFGAVAVRDGIILTEGWNGYVGTMPSCLKVGECIRTKLGIPSGTRREVAHCICAEKRVITTAAKEGIALDGATLYVTGLPCEVCVRLIVACGIRRVVYSKGYTGEKSHEQARLSGLEMIKMEI